MKNFRVLLIFLFTIFFTSNLYSKPVPPGAGEGDVAANILFLIDSSDSMKRPVGGVDSLEPVFGANYDSSGKIIISQGENKVGLVRFTAAGIRDESEYEDIQYIGNAGCANTVVADNNQKRNPIKIVFCILIFMFAFAWGSLFEFLRHCAPMMQSLSTLFLFHWVLQFF